MKIIPWLIIDVPMKVCGPAKFEKWHYIIAIMCLMSFYSTLLYVLP
jgi:hypothetical protein